MISTTVGQYRITGEIGRGGMGAVYAAQHTLIGRPAAVKVLLPELSQHQEMVTRFFNEARAATTIRHPGIVDIYDFGIHSDGSAYIVMEMLQGESLAARMARGRMSSTAALGFVRQITGALAAAHAKGIVHRDLKPDNVFLVPDPEVPGGERIKLLDFGIAKLAGDGGLGTKTRTGAVMGTPTYMAPEQCRGVAVDHRADLYSLGCIFFELCTGRPPFVGEGVGDVLAAHIHVPPPAVTSIAPDVPHELEVLVQRMLVKDPAQRVQSAEEVIHAVDLASGGASYRTGPPGRPAMVVPTSPHIAVTGGAGAASVAAPTAIAPSGVSWPPTTGGGESTIPPPPPSRRGLWAGLIAIALVGGAVAIIATQGGGAKKAPDPSPSASPNPDPTPSPDPNPNPNPNPDPNPIANPIPNPNPNPDPNPSPNPDPTPDPPSTIAVSIDSAPTGATVLRSGDVLGKTPFRGTLPRGDGEVTLIVRLSGHKDAQVVARADQPITRTVKLDKKRARPAGGSDDRDQGANPF